MGLDPTHKASLRAELMDISEHLDDESTIMTHKEVQFIARLLRQIKEFIEP